MESSLVIAVASLAFGAGAANDDVAFERIGGAEIAAGAGALVLIGVIVAG